MRQPKYKISDTAPYRVSPGPPENINHEPNYHTKSVSMFFPLHFVSPEAVFHFLIQQPNTAVARPSNLRPQAPGGHTGQIQSHKH